jgi:O-methyltransferase
MVKNGMPMHDKNDYLELLEKTLTFSLWPEPPRPVTLIAKKKLWRVRIARLADRFFQKFGLRLCADLPITPQQREDGPPHWTWMGHTLVSRKRLRNIRDLCSEVVSKNIPGEFVECGVWRGGASIYARACLPVDRKVILCDSFEGLPYDPAEPEYVIFDHLKVSVDEVRQNFKNYDQDKNLEFIKGYFCDTLKNLKTPIAILRADGDMYSSTMDILDNLYFQVCPGGFVIIDDYGLEPCARAVRDFLGRHKITVELVAIDRDAVYWKKP